MIIQNELHLQRTIHVCAVYQNPLTDYIYPWDSAADTSSHCRAFLMVLNEVTVLLEYFIDCTSILLNYIALGC